MVDQRLNILILTSSVGPAPKVLAPTFPIMQPLLLFKSPLPQQTFKAADSSSRQHRRSPPDDITW